MHQEYIDSMNKIKKRSPVLISKDAYLFVCMCGKWGLLRRGTNEKRKNNNRFLSTKGFLHLKIVGSFKVNLCECSNLEENRRSRERKEKGIIMEMINACRDKVFDVKEKEWSKVAQIFIITSAPSNYYDKESDIIGCILTSIAETLVLLLIIIIVFSWLVGWLVGLGYVKPK